MGDAKIPKTHARNKLSAGKGTGVIYRQCDEVWGVRGGVIDWRG